MCKKKDLCALAGISSASVTKMGKGGHVTTEVLAKICTVYENFVYQIAGDTLQANGNESLQDVVERDEKLKKELKVL